MAPHCDAPSPVGSFSQEYNMSYRPTLSSGLRTSESAQSSIYSDPAMNDSQYASSFSSSLVDMDEHHVVRRQLTAGVYVPTVCFFKDDDDEELDRLTIRSHAKRLARAGVTGLCTQGSNGEAVHLTHEERRIVTSETRQALNEAGYSSMPIIVGCGTQSIRETISYCKEAYAAGGDYALVLPPSYYSGLFKAGHASVIEYFEKVAEKSPIPLIIYNYPGAVSGMDLSSDIIIQLAENKNIYGVKLTCGNTGKLNRIASATRHLKKAHSTEGFLVLGGSADFTMQSLIGGGHGILAGLANISPKACFEIIKQYKQGNILEAQQLQEVVARGDWTAIQGGIVGTKAGLEGHLNYGGYGRSPLPRPDDAGMLRWKNGFNELIALENSL